MFVRHEIYQAPLLSLATYLGAYSNALLVSRMVRFTVRWVAWRKNIFQTKKFKFYFWRRYLRYLFIYPLIYTHEYIGAYLYVCIYACTISFPPRFTFHPSEPLRRGLFIFLRSYSVLLCSPHTFHLYEKFLFSARICYFTEQGLSYTYMYMYTRVYISMCGIFFIIIIISLPVLLGSCFHFQYFCIWMTKCFFCFYLYIFFFKIDKKKGDENS